MENLTPPPELVEQWREAPEFSALSPCTLVTVTTTKLQDIATRAAQWGADQEREACCEWLIKQECFYPISDLIKALRAARRPKPPSLAEEALTELGSIATAFRIGYGGDLVCDTIRRALERLQQLEAQQ